MEVRRTVTAGAVAYLLLLAACIALIHPFVNAGISDEFGYVKSAQEFAATGRIAYYGAATPMLGWLIPLGALFIKLFGFSFAAPRIATLLIAAANGILLQWILLRLGCNRIQALFGATAVMLSPVSLTEAMLFFTDGPGLLAMLITLTLCIKIVRAATVREIRFWIAVAFAVSFLLGTVRQLLWMDTLVMVPSAIFLVRKRRGVLPWSAACFVLAAIGIAYMLHWWNRQPLTLSEPLLMHYPLSAWTQYLILPQMELLVLLAPVLCLFLFRSVPKKFYIISALLALILPLTIMRNPHDLLRLSTGAIFGDAPQWVLLLSLALAAGLLPIAWRVVSGVLRQDGEIRSAENLSLYQLAVLLAPFSLAISLLVLSRSGFWLRYWLDVVAAITIWLVKVWSTLPKSRANGAVIGAAVLATYCSFSVIRTHDLYQQHAAILSLTQWYTAQGMPRDELEASYPFDGWYEIKRSGHVYDRRISRPAEASVEKAVPAKIAPCHNFFLPNTPSIRPLYGIGETVAPCFEAPVLHSVSYTAWMAPHRRTLFLASYEPEYALPIR